MSQLTTTELAQYGERVIDLNERVARYELAYKGHTIKVKRDFGFEPFLIQGMPVMWGYVVVKDGCNPMPGATWFQTVQDAKAGIDIWIAVGGPETVRKTMAGEPHDIMPGQEFWRRWSSFKRQNDKAREAHLAFWTEARD